MFERLDNKIEFEREATNSDTTHSRD